MAACRRRYVEVDRPGAGPWPSAFHTDPNRVFVCEQRADLTPVDGTDRRTHLRVTGPGRGGSPTPPAADAVMMRPDGKWRWRTSTAFGGVVAMPPYTGTAAS